MSALLLSFVVFLLIVAGVAAGAWLRNTLPQHQLGKDAQDVVRLGVGLVATMAALVLGLLIASAKSSFDTQADHVKQMTAQILILDNLLGEYGAEALPIRRDLRAVIGPFADRIWSEQTSDRWAPFESSAAHERVYLAVQSLEPKTD